MTTTTTTANMHLGALIPEPGSEHEQAPIDGNTVEASDPHASKVNPEDPRLSLPRPHSRVFRSTRALGIAILCVGGTAGAVMWSLRHTNVAATATAPEPPKVPSHPPAVPAFLQELPDAPTTSRRPLTEPSSPTSAVPTAQRPEPRPLPPLAPPTRPDPALERRAQLDEQARTSGLFFESGGDAYRGRAAPPAPLAAAPSMPSGPPGFSMPGAGASAASGQSFEDPNFQARKNAFLDAPPDLSDYLPSALQPALSPYEVQATTIIPATLLTGVNSDLPGPIIAQVRERVYDSVTGQHLLIPQGARLLAAYDSMVAWGQERVLLCWHRLIFPNGSSINLKCMPAADLAGQAGLSDEVDNHWDRLIAATGLSTVLSLGAQAAAGDPSGYQPNLAQRAAGNAAGQINSAGQAVVSRSLNLQPTITIRPGFGLNVIVTKDMILQPYVD